MADVAVGRPAGRIDREDALDVDELEAAVRAGRELADDEAAAGTDLLLVGHLGVGGTTAAAVIVAALTGVEPVAVVGRGSRLDGAAIDDATWMRKAAAVRDALRRAKAADRDPAALLRIAGGADLAALAGLLAQSAARGIPVVLDGLVTLAAALVADRLAQGARAWWLAGQAEPEPAHRLALEQLGLSPLLDLGVGGGDGTGALAALPLLRIAGARGGHRRTVTGAVTGAVRGLGLAVGWLTVLPVRAPVADRATATAAIRWAPVVGLLLGIGAAAVLGAAGRTRGTGARRGGAGRRRAGARHPRLAPGRTCRHRGRARQLRPAGRRRSPYCVIPPSVRSAWPPWSSCSIGAGRGAGRARRRGRGERPGSGR